jgi:hypothetical protein
MFSHYVVLVKNLRGVVLVGPSDAEASQLVQWLKQRFRYRNVGVSPSIIKNYPTFFESRLSGNPFVQLAYPLESLARLTEYVTQKGNIYPEIAEVVILASAYASPVICLGSYLLDKIQQLSMDAVHTTIELSDKDWRLHLRIADYSILDLYRWSTEQARYLWQNQLNGFVEARQDRISHDKKRYWRLQQGNKTLKPFLYYLDLAQTIARNQTLRKSLIELPESEVCAGLAIVPVVIVI